MAKRPVPQYDFKAFGNQLNKFLAFRRSSLTWRLIQSRSEECMLSLFGYSKSAHQNTVFLYGGRSP